MQPGGTFGYAGLCGRSFGRDPIGRGFDGKVDFALMDADFVCTHICSGKALLPAHAKAYHERARLGKGYLGRLFLWGDIMFEVLLILMGVFLGIGIERDILHPRKMRKNEMR